MTTKGGWRLFVGVGDPWTPATWTRVVTAARALPAIHRSKHATTYRSTSGGREIYVKVYRPYGWRTTLKDMLRASKARHVQRISARLAARGFAVPEVLAVGERRSDPVVREAWLATAALSGMPVATALVRADQPLAKKRSTLAAVGAACGRLHDAGFIAGDLVASNVWIDARGGVVFLDHDRTTEARWTCSWWRARRNLVQLNRLVLPGVSVTDRLRVYHAYVRTRGWTMDVARRRLGWVVRKTIQRRQRFDGVSREEAARVSFRELMRAPTGGHAS